MALALLGYFGTMVTALAVLMTLLASVLTTYQTTKRPLSYPMAVIEQTAQSQPSNDPITSSGRWGPPGIHRPTEAATLASAEDPQSVAAKQAAADKAKRLKQARDQKRQQDLARQELARQQLTGQRDDRAYSTALGFASEQTQTQQTSSTALNLFDFFGSRRF
jgi:hypothetical protein